MLNFLYVLAYVDLAYLIYLVWTDRGLFQADRD